MNKLEIVIQNTIIDCADEKWVSDSYEWTDDFVEHYFVNWFYDSVSCFYYINNDIHNYHYILSILNRHGYPFVSIVDAFNLYVILTAKLSFQNHDVMLHIQNVIRIQKLKRLLPCIIHKILLPELWSPISIFIGKKY
jgi:hypothetical protein